jgi:hypothetical protein
MIGIRYINMHVHAFFKRIRTVNKINPLASVREERKKKKKK